MKVKYIVPCVCIDHMPDAEDACDYGMPDIAVGEGEWFSCYCRNCGRGGRWLDRKSAYHALKHWNRVQFNLWGIRYENENEPWVESMYAFISQQEMRREE